MHSFRRTGMLAAVAAIGLLMSSDALPQSSKDNRAAALGWNEAALERVFDYAKSLPTDSLLIVSHGEVVRSLGDVSKRYNVHSVRKAFLSALVGRHLGTGPRQIDLNATLADLGIDDAAGPLTPKQRQATVLHLIKSVSGINHLAAAAAGMQRDVDRRLGRAENEPGSKWAYNNWDYNALTTIFETRTGLTVAEAFKSGIAERIGLEDISPASSYYIYEPKLSQHRAAMFRMSARDMARLGQLYLANGEWQGKRVLPADWVERITKDHVSTGDPGLLAGHGYLWWIPGKETGLPAGSFFALGLGFQAIVVVPAWRTVIVHQADTWPFLERVAKLMREQNIDFAAASQKLVEFCRDPANAESDFCRRDRFLLKAEFDRLIALIVEARAQ
jgi:CubicO group peptidase (beta-lactamase class C family)